MAKAGRKRLAERPIARQIHIPETVVAKVDLILYNPRTGVRRHGAWSALVTQLLREWLEKQGAQA